MWGSHVDAEIREASQPLSRGKQKQEETKIRTRINQTVKRLMESEVPETELIVSEEDGQIRALPPVKKAPKTFRDPAEAFRK